jgi:hypothetical protein
MKRCNGSLLKIHNGSNFIPIEILYKPEIVVERKFVCILHQKIESRRTVQERNCKYFYLVRVVGRSSRGLYSFAC